MTAHGEWLGVVRTPRARAAARFALRRGVLAPVLCLLACGATLFPSSGRDDAYLTYWPAHTLATTGEILNLNGARVEQSSSLLEVVLLAAAAKLLPLPLPVLGLLLSLAAGVGCVVLARRVERRLGTDYHGASWLVASCTPLVYWSFSGLETPLAALLALGVVAAYAAHLEHARRALPGPALATLTLLLLAVRPEGFPVLACALAATLALTLVRGHSLGPRPRAMLAGLGAWVALGFGALVGFRLAYFGSAFPQPVLAKSFTRIATGGLLPEVIAGIDYLAEHTGTLSFAPFWLGIAGAVLALRRVLRGGRATAFDLLGGLFCIAYLAFVATTGGDYMEGARYLVPFLPVALLIACGWLRRAFGEAARPVLVGLVGLQLVGSVVFARYHSTGIPLPHALAEDFAHASRFSWPEVANRVHRRDLALAERLPVLVARLAEHSGRPVTLLSRQMGLVPYHVALETAGRVRFLDAYGLATRDVTQRAFLPLLPAWRRDPFGTLLAEPERIAAVWGEARPDVLYDLGDPPADLDARGYRVVFRQHGLVQGPSRALHGGLVRASCWLAVRADLLPALGDGPDLLGG